MKIPENFILGAASSMWQTEGWCDKLENQDSYIDWWYKEAKHVWHNEIGPDTATDFYNLHDQDIKCMKEIGLTHYRTSINWSRFLTDYEKVIVDEKYASFIETVIDKLIKNNIEPMICLEHYEIPRFLFEKYGAWNSKKVIELFVKYAEKAFERFGSKVKFWFVFNEPSVVQTRVYLDAIRFPYHQDTKIWMQWNFNKSLATALVIELYKKTYKGRIGTIINPEVVYPRSTAKHDLKAAEMYDLFHNRMYVDPAVLGEVPKEIFDLMNKHNIAFEYTEDELKIIKNNTVDFLGINLYYPKRIKARNFKFNEEIPFHPEYYYEEHILPGRKMNLHRGWEIYPEIIYDMGMRMKNEYNNIPWIIAENGMGVENEKQYKVNNIIQDDYRIDFIKIHLEQTLKVTNEGSNCFGYMLWAFTDNVSPMNSFKNRYGLVEIDLENNLQRNIKKSGFWYKDLIKNKKL